MSPRRVNPEKKERKQRAEGAPLPEQAGRSRARLAAAAVMGVLVLLGGATLGLSVYVARQTEGFELTLNVGGRTTHVLGTNVTLTEGADEKKCVLSLLDFRSVRAKAVRLVDAKLADKNARGLPTFELAVATAPPTLVRGALPMSELEPIEQLVISKASACIETSAAR